LDAQYRSKFALGNWLYEKLIFGMPGDHGVETLSSGHGEDVGDAVPTCSRTLNDSRKSYSWHSVQRESLYLTASSWQAARARPKAPKAGSCFMDELLPATPVLFAVFLDRWTGI
jgi:hypothetical protein